MRSSLKIVLLSSWTMLAFIFSGSAVSAQSVSGDSASVDRLYEQSKKYWFTKRDSALYYLHAMEEQATRINYQRGRAYALYGYGVIEPVMYKQFQFFTRSLTIFEALQEKFGIGLNLVKIGGIYDAIGQPQKAVAYYRHALEVKKEVGDFGGMALALINIGIYYNAKGEYETALMNFEESLVYRLKVGNRQGIGYAQVNIAETFFHLNRIGQALTMADSAIVNFSKTTDELGQLMSLYLRGQLLQKLNRQKEAEEIFESITAFPDKVQFMNYAQDAKKQLVRIYSQRGDINRAFKLQTEYLARRDSMARQDYRSETERLVNEFEFTRMEQQALLENQAQTEKLNRRNRLEYLIISVVVLVIFVLLFSGRRKLPDVVAKVILLIGLLLLFEFLLVLTDSTVENITQGEPVLKLLANFLMALLLLPGHQFLERYIHKRFLQIPDATKVA